MDEGWDERRDKMRDHMGDQMKDEMRDEMRQELRWDKRWLMRSKKRHLPFLIYKNLYLFLALVTDSKAFIFSPAGATFDGKCSSIVTNRLYSNISQKKTSFINAMISNKAYSFEKT